MKYISSSLTFLKNKYVIAIALFLVWMTFFDERDWGMIMERRHKLRELEKSEKHLSVQIAETRKELEQLKTNAQTIERYAREKYYMKKDNEDLFIVNPAEKK